MAEPTIPSQNFVEIKEIKNGVIFLKNGQLRKILMVSGINFDLKSEIEQEAILGSFQRFLNSLDFSIQFFIHSRKINIENYLNYLYQKKEEETNELLKVQIEDYIEFIKELVEKNAIISKTFFVVVPYNPVVLTQQKNPLADLFSFFKPANQKKQEEEEKLKREKENLAQLERRVEQVINGLTEIGLKAIPLEDEVLIELFYNLYNPQLVEKKGLKIEK